MQGATSSKARFLAELQGAPGTAAAAVPNPGSGVGGKLAVPIGGFAVGISAVSAAAHGGGTGHGARLPGMC